MTTRWKWRLKKALMRIRHALFPRPTYVVVYDGWDSDRQCDTEEYYGYFSSPSEARMMFTEFRGENRLYHNARICRQVETISDLPGTEAA